MTGWNENSYHYRKYMLLKRYGDAFGYGNVKIIDCFGAAAGSGDITEILLWDIIGIFCDISIAALTSLREPALN